MIVDLITSLALTLIIELAASLIMGVRDKTDLVIIALANVCTNPVAVYVAACVKHFAPDTAVYAAAVAALEIAAIAVEFIIFKICLSTEKIKPLRLSVINNAVSFALGLLITVIF